MKKGLLVLVVLFLCLFSSAVYAAPSFTGGFVDNGTDNFYYTSQTAYFNVTVIWPSPTEPGNLTVNCSNLGGSAIVNATNSTTIGPGSVSYWASCTINYSAIPGASSTGFTSLSGGNVTFTATNASGFPNSTIMSGAIVAYNFTVPSTGFTWARFGALMTNMSTVTNFNSVNYTIHVEVNVTDPFYPSGWSDFKSGALYNFTSLNMTAPDIGQQLSALRPTSGINVNISQNSSTNSYIFLNSTALGAFNTSVVLKIFGLPFRSMPNVTTSDGSINNSYTMNYTYGGGKGNLTFKVNSFSTYNATDFIAPIITVNSPTTGTTQNLLINVTFNGTSSSINNNSILVTVTNTSATIATYNYSNFTCTSANDDERVTCNRTSTLADGTYTVIFNVTDLGAGSGNRASSTVSNVKIDATAPVVSLVSPTNITNITNNYVTLTFNVTDATADIDCNLYLDSPANTAPFGNISAINMSSGGTNVSTITGLSLGLHNWTVECYDGITIPNLNNYGVSQTWFFTVVDSGAPSVTLNSPAVDSYTNLTSINFNCSATDSISLKNVSLYLNSTGAFARNTTNSSPVNGGTHIFAKTLAVGTYLWSCEACDNSNNCAFATANRTLTIDQTTPNITTTPSASVTSTTATISWTTTEATNSSVSYGLNTSLGTTATSATFTTSNSVGITSLTASTLYYYNVTSCDQASNCNSSGGYNFTTSAATTTDDDGDDGGSSGGGSGSASRSIEGQYVMKSWGYVAPGTTAELPITNGEIGITQVEFTAIGKIYTAVMSVKKLDALPSNTANFDKKVYRYLEIKATNIDDEKIENAKINFKIAKTWLTENNFDKNSMALFHYVNGAWVELTTTLGEEDADYINYVANTPGFSYFLIGAKTAAAAREEPTLPPEETVEVTPAPPTVGETVAAAAKSTTTWVIVIIALVVIAGVIYFFVIKKKK